MSKQNFFRPRLPQTLSQAVKEQAQQRGITANDLVIEILIRALLVRDRPVAVAS